MANESDSAAHKYWSGNPRFYWRELVRVGARPNSFRYRALQNQIRSAARSYSSLLPAAIVFLPLLVFLYSDSPNLSLLVAGAALVVGTSIFGLLSFSASGIAAKIEDPRRLALMICGNALVAAIGWSLFLSGLYSGSPEETRLLVLTLQSG
ncbi:hypothetical protein HFP57_00015 [Parasphingopyxis algicola]|uniref:hypothetical protein n=1 Tax=Parasphingopyxis algicola TaxID=2026624 RepID=UPI0015A2888E|nr:hypothetical protein [Parasphingopyxis algicola]QLC23573.1 hypothetical protein HFP57_00015 [Parasphingopyxis algicola]